eukprot:1967656-Rhodomonas_salina.1
MERNGLHPAQPSGWIGAKWRGASQQLALCMGCVEHATLLLLQRVDALHRLRGFASREAAHLLAMHA